MTRTDVLTERSLLDVMFTGLLKARWRWIAAAAAISLGGLVLSVALPQPWDSQAGLLLIGGLGGFVASILFPWLRIPRKHLRQEF
ncbi:hypothetical protein [Serratia ficaria]|uniref:hypothetical protein n=1 Tax=Serratia ficaria TaxID=61651 RepID=UPI0021B70241|nr:hypothetical protein [Serratia ficaria]